MILAIGDIHGCDTALKTMLDLVQPSKDDLVITLGDYVDRGPDSKAVIQTLLDFKSSHQLVHLMGNHEIQMIRALEARHHMERFLDPLCGGQDTLDNYGGSFEQIPDDHWEFITSGKLFYETESHIFVHAGLEPDIDLDKQDSETYYYKRFHGVKPHKSGKPYICGHTIQGDSPTNKGYAICLDTCAYGGGWLTALDVQSGKCWQTNERGQSRVIEI